MLNEEDIRQRLDGFILAFSASGDGDRPNARFGHIKIPGFRLQGPSLMELIRQSLSSVGFENVIFVTSDMERAVGSGFAEDGTAPPMELAFSQLLACVKMNRADAGHVTAWKSPKDGTWEQHAVLPRDIAIVFQIDPSVPADCALALIAICQWAMDVSSEAGSHIRLLTLATDDDCNFLSKLTLGVPGVPVDHLDLSVQDVSFITESAQTTINSTRDTMATLKGIAEDFRRDPTVPQLVLSFRADGLAGDYREMNTLTHIPVVEHADEHQNLLRFATYLGDGQQVWLTVSPALSLLPIQFQGYGKIHILLGSERVSVGWDNITEQMAENSRWTSGEERQAQLQWARQPPRSEVHIHLDDEGIGSKEEAIKLFTGSTNWRRRQVENCQMGGFIAAVVDIASWGLDIHRVLTCFIRYPSRISCMKGRLEAQQIITPTTLNLCQGEAIVFTKVLPLVSYDYRLAFFVALESDKMVRKVKIQLAAIISSGMEDLVILRPDQLGDPRGEKARQILDSCWGYCKGMEKHGTFWLLLNLWKGFDVARCNGDEQEAPWKELSVIGGVSHRANYLIKSISKALLDVHVESAAHQTFEDESRPFKEERKRVLQTHLLQAYIFQLTGGYKGLAGGEAGPQERIIYRLFTNDVLVTLPRDVRSVTSLISIERLLEESGDDMVMGIFDKILRIGTNANCLMDWTLIPKDLVAKWLADHRPNLPLRLALGSMIKQCPINVDEVDGREA
ncbi:hypothetical protein FBULB1_7833 [Fusarium bulbicola]|nr:hypothetical protein FBULB1_7833 [Fusarium bulbicola]